MTTLTKDPLDKQVYVFDFDDHLAASVQITGTPTVTPIGLTGDTTTTPVTVDNVSLVTGNRKVQVRVLAGALGSFWRVTCHIVTNETPAQEFDKSFWLLVYDK